jgi:hypothetical protein
MLVSLEGDALAGIEGSEKWSIANPHKHDKDARASEFPAQHTNNAADSEPSFGI